MLTVQEKAELKRTIQSNQHEIFVVSFEEMDAIVRSSPSGNKPEVQKSWQAIKDKVGLGANYYSSADDALKMVKLIGELGGVGAQAYIKTYGGKPHIILKGRPGLRKILTGTKYGVNNPKVVTMGLGRAGAVKAAKAGGILTVVLLSAYRVADYVLTDEATLTQLIGTLAVDVVKVGISTGASIAAAAFVAGVTTLAVGPILAVLIVGVGASLLLDNLDQKYGITDRVIAGLDELSDKTQQAIARQKRQLENSVARAADSVIDYAIDSAKQVMVKWVQGQLGKYFSSLPIIR